MKLVHIEGMMCHHCEAHVKKALEKIEGVVCAEANFETGLVKLEVSAPVDEALIKAAIENADYEYVGIK